MVIGYSNPGSGLPYRMLMGSKWPLESARLRVCLATILAERHLFPSPWLWLYSSFLQAVLGLLLVFDSPGKEPHGRSKLWGLPVGCFLTIQKKGDLSKEPPWLPCFPRTSWGHCDWGYWQFVSSLGTVPHSSPPRHDPQTTAHTPCLKAHLPAESGPLKYIQSLHLGFSKWNLHKSRVHGREPKIQKFLWLYVMISSPNGSTLFVQQCEQMVASIACLAPTSEVL